MRIWHTMLASEGRVLPRTTRREWRRVGSATSKRASEPWLEPLRDAYACIVVPLASRLAISTQIIPGVECLRILVTRVHNRRTEDTASP